MRLSDCWPGGPVPCMQRPRAGSLHQHCSDVLAAGSARVSASRPRHRGFSPQLKWSKALLLAQRTIPNLLDSFVSMYVRSSCACTQCLSGRRVAHTIVWSSVVLHNRDCYELIHANSRCLCAFRVLACDAALGFMEAVTGLRTMVTKKSCVTMAQSEVIA